MAETSIVFNDQLELFGQRYINKVAPIPVGEETLEPWLCETFSFAVVLYRLWR